jgi:hypothetical protein
MNLVSLQHWVRSVRTLAEDWQLTTIAPHKTAEQQVIFRSICVVETARWKR